MDVANVDTGTASAASGTILSNETVAESASAQAAPTAEATTAATDWRSSLPEDIRGEASLKTIHDIPSLAKSYLHAQKMIGANKVPLPSKHATDDDWQKFYDQVGRPAVDKYEVKAPKDAKFIDEAWIKELTPIAHKSGIMPPQLEKLVNWYEEKNAKVASEMQAQKEAEVKAGIAGLQKEWGKAYEQKISYAKQLLKENGDADLIKWIDESGMGNNPNLIKIFSKLGEDRYREDSLASGGEGKPIYSPAQAVIKANEILVDTSHPYNNPDHPNHKAAVQEVKALYDMVHPEEPKT